MHMNDYEQLVVTRLEEKMLDVAEQDVYMRTFSQTNFVRPTNRTHRLSVPSVIDTVHHFGEFQPRQEASSHREQDG